MVGFRWQNVLSGIALSVGFFFADVLHSQTREEIYFPLMDQWETCSESSEIETEKIKQAVEFAEARNSSAVLVLLNGRILAEEYWKAATKNSSHSVYSVSKSVVSTLIGIGIADGKIGSVEDPVGKYISEWSGKKAYEQIQIKHLLTMTSGLENRKRITIAGALSRNERGYTTSLPVKNNAGKKWDYHSSAYRLLFHVLAEAYDSNLQSITRTKLLKPIGMNSTRWSTKRRAPRENNYLTMTARDAGRFGLLILAGGAWRGQTIVPAEWVKAATSRSVESANPAYGYLWWLNGGEYYYLPLNSRKHDAALWPNCPQDAFAALGKDDQKIFVVPSKGIVAIRFGDAAYSSTLGNSQFDDQFLSLICDAVKKRD